MRTGVFVRQITLVLAIITTGLWGGTQYCAWQLGYQLRLGSPDFAHLAGSAEIRDLQNIADILVDPEGALERRNHWEKPAIRGHQRCRSKPGCRHKAGCAGTRVDTDRPSTPSARARATRSQSRSLDR
jgi:hypothetical protein